MSQATTEPLERVFVAMPFDIRFDPLYSAISEAVNQAELMPYRSDRKLKQKNWSVQIEHEIRRASILIAVCTPEADSGVPSGNVLHELGFAKGCGTPILILTDATRNLPANLRTEDALTYPEPLEGPARREFLSDLCNRIQANRAPGRATRPTPPSQDALFWAAITLLEFVHNLQRTYLIVLDPLRTLDSVMAMGRASPEAAQRLASRCQESWREYLSLFQAVSQLELEKCRRDCGDQLRASGTLEAAEGDAARSGLQGKLKGLVDIALREFPARHDGLKGEFEKAPQVFDDGPDRRLAFHELLLQLSHAGQTVVQLADGLMSDLVAASKRHGRSHG
jgi:hypothetical protein